ncbi:hypothetical protein ACLBXM_18625 [Xanthobacteraceae bacterium A53D]
MVDRKREADRLKALAKLMDSFAKANWNDSYSAARGALSIDGDVLRCTVGHETVEGHAGAPLLFVSGAWALIFAHECDGRFGHMVDGRLNRVWPNAAGGNIAQHGMDDAVKAWAKLWPEVLFSSSLYRDVETPGHPRSPSVMDDAPSSTTLNGILKRVVTQAGDADPLQRLKVAEFIEDAVRREWSYTAEDMIMKTVGKAILAFADDAEPAVRELGLLALETCTEACWQNRAYGLYEPLCRRLIEAGLNAHLQYARLAESAYAGGDLAEGDRLFAIAAAGQNPLRALKLSAAYDHVGDWSDLQTRILRQAGGAQFGYSNGNDPNDARNAKLAKKGIKPPAEDVAQRHRALAVILLNRAAEGAEARLAIDLPAAREGRKVPLGAGDIDPAGRRLFLEEIFYLQSQIAMKAGDADARLRNLFRAMTIGWVLNGENDAWRAGVEDEVVALAQDRDDAALERLGMPAYLKPLMADGRKAQAMSGSDEGRQQLVWQAFMAALREEFLAKTDIDYNPLPGEDLIADFAFAFSGGEMTISHKVLAEPVRGSLAAPVLTMMRAWNRALAAAHGIHAQIKASSYVIFTFDAAGVVEMARLGGAALEAGARAEAIALYRFAHGTDPLVKPWPYRDPVPPLPLDEVPEDLRADVARLSPLEADNGHEKLKPRGRRGEQLAKDYAAAGASDVVTARFIGQCMRDVCSVSESDIERALKAARPLLTQLWRYEDAGVREVAMIALCGLLRQCAWFLPRADVKDLLALADEGDICDPADIRPDPERLAHLDAMYGPAD